MSSAIKVSSAIKISRASSRGLFRGNDMRIHIHTVRDFPTIIHGTRMKNVYIMLKETYFHSLSIFYLLYVYPIHGGTLQ